MKSPTKILVTIANPRLFLYRSSTLIHYPSLFWTELSHSTYWILNKVGWKNSSKLRVTPRMRHISNLIRNPVNWPTICILWAYARLRARVRASGTGLRWSMNFCYSSNYMDALSLRSPMTIKAWSGLRRCSVVKIQFKISSARITDNLGNLSIWTITEVRSCWQWRMPNISKTSSISSLSTSLP